MSNMECDGENTRQIFVGLFERKTLYETILLVKIFMNKHSDWNSKLLRRIGYKILN